MFSLLFRYYKMIQQKQNIRIFPLHIKSEKNIYLCQNIAPIFNLNFFTFVHARFNLYRN